MDKLKILLPKGRIYDNVSALFSDAGISIYLPERTYRPIVNQDDLEAKVMKPQNIGKLLELGAHDVGFTGIDWIRETGADVVEIMDLGFDKVRIVAAVPNEIDDSMLRSKRMIVATEYVANAEVWLKAQKLNYLIVRTYGATEVFPPDDADMIIDNTATGRTLQENGLRIIDTIRGGARRAQPRHARNERVEGPLRRSRHRHPRDEEPDRRPPLRRRRLRAQDRRQEKRSPDPDAPAQEPRRHRHSRI